MGWKRTKSWLQWGALVALLTLGYSALVGTAEGELISWWVWSAPFLLMILLYVIYKTTKVIFGHKKEKPKAGPAAAAEEDTQPPTPAKKDDRGASHGSSAGHGDDHHGPSLFQKAFALAFLLVVLTGCVWFILTLRSLKDVPNVKHPVQVMTAGSNSVPVGSRSLGYDPNPEHYCVDGVPQDAVSNEVRDSWTVVDIPEHHRICVDPGPRPELLSTQECRTLAGDWERCDANKRFRHYRFKATVPVTTWMEIRPL